MTRIAILLLLHHITQNRCFCASVTLILHGDKHWLSVSCPPIKSGNRVDVTKADRSIFSTTNVRFKCVLSERHDKNLSVYTPYHFSLFLPLESGVASPECSNIDECFHVRLTQEVNTVNVNVRALKPCFSSKLSLRYELRHGNSLLDTGITLTIFGKSPDQPSSLHFQLNGSKVLSIDGFIQHLCRRDALSLTYSMQYNIRGVLPCQLTNQFSSCHIENTTFMGRYKVSCPVNTICSSEAMCSAVVTAVILGVNKVGQKSEVSRRFSKSLAFTTGRSLSLNITSQTLNSVTINFNKPVTCSSAHQHFQYRISYKKLLESKWISFHDHSCREGKHCTANIAGLKMNTRYIICVSYRNIFDIVSAFSEASCKNASTAQLPCKAPKVYRITPIRIDVQYWKAIVYWNVIEKSCWNANSNMNSMSYYYRVEINGENTTISYRYASQTNHSYGGLSYLRYHQKYSVTLSSCNIYGCINGPKSYLYIKHAQSKAKQDTSQTVTETILICVLSLLFLAASTFLYFIVKKRKQFQRLKLKRKLRPEDIQIVREDNIRSATTNVVSRGLDTTPQASTRRQERRLIKVDTRPLITHKTSVIACGIPENSTLV